MADIIELHPSVREHRKPRLPAAALAEYLILRPDQQDTVLHNSRFSSPPHAVSVQPDLLIEPTALDGVRRVGGLMFRPQKAPDPEACRLDETRRQRGEHRREMARYMAVL